MGFVMRMRPLPGFSSSAGKKRLANALLQTAILRVSNLICSP